MRSGKGNHFAAGLSMRLGHHCKKQRRRRFTQLVLTCFGSARATKMTGAIPLIQPSNRCFITRQPHVPTNSYTCLETSSPHVSTCFFWMKWHHAIYIYTRILVFAGRKTWIPDPSTKYDQKSSIPSHEILITWLKTVSQHKWLCSYPLVICYIAIEKQCIVDLPINIGDFP